MEDKYPTLHAEDPRSNHLIVLDCEEPAPEILSVKSAALRGRHIVDGKRKDKIYSDTQQMLEIGDEKSNCLTSVCKDSLLSITVAQLGNSNKFGNDTNDSEKSHTLKASRPDGVILNDRIRRLTPLECERLQGVPDNYTNCGVSDTQRYKCLGNAFNVDVVAHILNYIDKEQPTNALMEL
jgi:site-specific DNA-cytosine methylase